MIGIMEPVDVHPSAAKVEDAVYPRPARAKP